MTREEIESQIYMAMNTNHHISLTYWDIPGFLNGH